MDDVYCQRMGHLFECPLAGVWEFPWLDKLQNKLPLRYISCAPLKYFLFLGISESEPLIYVTTLIPYPYLMY